MGHGVDVTAYNSFFDETQFNVESPTGQWTSLSTQVRTRASRTSVTMFGTGSPQDATLKLVGEATPSGAGWSRFNGNTYVPNPISYADKTFSITQNTAVIFSTAVDVSVHGEDLAPGSSLGSRATAELQFALSAEDGTYYTEDWAKAAGNSDDRASFSQSVSKTMDLYFSNRSATDQRSGVLYASAKISGESYVSAVPEPQAVATLLMGVAVVSLAARRRQSGHQQQKSRCTRSGFM